MKGRIGLIGRIDADETLFDGQTVKTRTLYRMLVGRYGEQALLCADTRDYRQRPVRVALSVVRCIAGADRIVVALSSNGRAQLFPVLHLAARVLRRGVYHSLIGGWLASDIRRDARLVRRLNSFRVNWVESKILRDELTSLGVANARYLPNFKHLTPIERNALAWRPKESIRLCIFSRIQERKGVTDALRAVAELNGLDGRRVQLDLYGPIDPDYEAALDELLATTPGARYCGVVPAEQSVQTISRYDGLLFPTRYYEEGIPGTVLDALAAGLPVIAARWRYYSEILEDGLTGLSYEMYRADKLAPAIRALYFENRDLLEIKIECLYRSARYKPEAAFQEMVSALDGEAPYEMG